jgi:hypothetical protein
VTEINPKNSVQEFFVNMRYFTLPLLNLKPKLESVVVRERGV